MKLHEFTYNYFNEMKENGFLLLTFNVIVTHNILMILYDLHNTSKKTNMI